jgi:hypothetical protein
MIYELDGLTIPTVWECDECWCTTLTVSEPPGWEKELTTQIEIIDGERFETECVTGKVLCPCCIRRQQCI